MSEQSQILWFLDGLIQTLPNFDAILETDILQWFRDIPGFKSAILLRQIHALEHATVSILSGEAGAGFAVSQSLMLDACDRDQLGGITTEQGFYLYGSVRRLDLVRAAKSALERLTRGEGHLAVHPRCSTNWPIQILLQSSLMMGLHAVLPKDPFDQLMGMGLATSLATELAPEAEIWWQRYVMTAIPFNLEIAEINAVTDDYGTPAHFVRVDWVECQNHV